MGGVQLEPQGALADQALLGADTVAVGASAFIGILFGAIDVCGKRRESGSVIVVPSQGLERKARPKWGSPGQVFIRHPLGASGCATVYKEVRGLSLAPANSPLPNLSPLNQYFLPITP